jgi:hypothetical protein
MRVIGDAVPGGCILFEASNSGFWPKRKRNSALHKCASVSGFPTSGVGLSLATNAEHLRGIIRKTISRSAIAIRPKAIAL